MARPATADGRELTREEIAALVVSAAVAPSGLREDWQGRSFAWLLEHWPTEPVRLFGGYLLRLGALGSAGIGLIFEGIPGSAKSGCLALLAQAVSQQAGGIWLPPPGEQRIDYRDRPRVVYVTLPGLMDFLLQRNTDDIWRQRLDDLQRCPHLLIDEVGTEYSEPFGGQRFFELLDGRLSSGRATHLATNGTAADLRQSPIGERLYHRLKAKNHRIIAPSIDFRAPRSVDELAGW